MFRAPAFRCADWFNRGNPVCEPGLSMPRQTLERLRALTLASLARIGDELDAVSVWDPLPILCPEPVCHALRGSRPLVFVGDHLSAYSTRLLREPFEETLSVLDARGT